MSGYCLYYFHLFSLLNWNQMFSLKNGVVQIKWYPISESKSEVFREFYTNLLGDKTCFELMYCHLFVCFFYPALFHYFYISPYGLWMSSSMHSLLWFVFIPLGVGDTASLGILSMLFNYVSCPRPCWVTQTQDLYTLLLSWNLKKFSELQFTWSVILFATLE